MYNVHVTVLSIQDLSPACPSTVGSMQSILPIRAGPNTSVPGGMISVPIVLTPELAQLRQDVVNVGGLSLSATMGIGALASSGIGSSRMGKCYKVVKIG